MQFQPPNHPVFRCWSLQCWHGSKGEANNTEFSDLYSANFGNCPSEAQDFINLTQIFNLGCDELCCERQYNAYHPKANVHIFLEDCFSQEGHFLFTDWKQSQMQIISWNLNFYYWFRCYAASEKIVSSIKKYQLGIQEVIKY